MNSPPLETGLSSGAGSSIFRHARLFLAIIVISMIMITLAVLVAIKSLTPDSEEGHRIYPKLKTPGKPANP